MHRCSFLCSEAVLRTRCFTHSGLSSCVAIRREEAAFHRDADFKLCGYIHGLLYTLLAACANGAKVLLRCLGSLVRPRYLPCLTNFDYCLLLRWWGKNPDWHWFAASSASEYLARERYRPMENWYREIKERCVLYVEYGLMTASASGLLYVFYAMSR